MIVTNNFVFIHLHRTGGQFIRNTLFNWFPTAREIGYHFPLSMLPRRYQHLPVLGFIRDPWDWYVSWYHYNAAKPRNPIYKVASQNGCLGFADTIRHLLYLGSSQSPYRDLKTQMIKCLPKIILGNQGAGITRSALENFNSADYGYYSWLANRMFSGEMNTGQLLKLGRFAYLKADFVTILRDFGCQVTPSMIKKLNLSIPVNCSNHTNSLYYYDEALKQEIENQEWLSIQQLSGQFVKIYCGKNTVVSYE